MPTRLRLVLLLAALVLLPYVVACETAGTTAPPDTSAPAPEVSGGEDVPGDVYTPADDDNLIDGWDLLIVTTEAMRGAFEELADWRRQTGLPTRVVTMEEVMDGAESPDRAVALRSFLQKAHRERGTRIVLLGGDTPHIPHRMVYAAMSMGGSELGYEHDCETAAELYFSDLDGDWDGNGNGEYGEFEDDLDMRPDVALGRVPAYGYAVALQYVDKVLAYERGESDDYQQRVLFLSEDTGFGGIDSAYLLDRWDGFVFDERYEIEKLYHISGPYPDAAPNTDEAEIAALESGKGMVVHLGHGATGWLAYLSRDDVNNLRNAPRTNVFFSCACYAGDFTGESQQSAGELYVMNPEGGGVAYIGNTDVGIGLPPGALFLQAMLDELLEAVDAPRLGEAFATARMTFAPNGGGSWTELHEDRYTQMVVILLGDPALRMWRVTPRPVELELPAEVATDGALEATVRLAGGGPLAGATVTAYQKNRLLRVKQTDSAGRVRFDALDALPGPVTVTVSGLDARPVERAVEAR